MELAQAVGQVFEGKRGVLEITLPRSPGLLRDRGLHLKECSATCCEVRIEDSASFKLMEPLQQSRGAIALKSRLP